LNPDQIAKAKEVNGARKKITHALLCGPHGQIFGTEKHCVKYYSAWKEIFPLIFHKASITDGRQIDQFESTFNLVNILIAEHDRLEGKVTTPSGEVTERKSKKGFFKKLFGK